MAKIAILIVLVIGVVYGAKGFSTPRGSRPGVRRIRRSWRSWSESEQFFVRILAAIAFLALMALLAG